MAAHRFIAVHRDLTAKNATFAARNRERFRDARLAVLNLLSAPGSGKTALLERTLADLAGTLRVAVVVGDLATDNDARRLARSGAPVVQLATGTVCHLEASMVGRACDGLDLSALDLLVIENVGNLVCPAGYDLGEGGRVVLLAVTEGEDKPLKYPTAFQSADLVLVTKTDLAEPAGFDRAAALSNLRQVSRAAVIDVSARSGAGLSAWYEYLRGMVADARG